VRRLIVGAAIALTVILYVVSYAAVFLMTLIATSLNLPGPTSDDPFGWIWAVLIILTVFGTALGFCWWFARTVKKRVQFKDTFE
jgi:drug/metabolite transporter (DMT)-like permease